MKTSLVTVSILVLLSTAAPAVAAPDEYPDNRNCNEAQTLDDPSDVYSGRINSPNDRDNVFITQLEKGEYLSVEISVPPDAGSPDFNLDNPENSVTTVGDLENARAESVAGWASAVVSTSEGPARAKFFAESTGQVCLSIDENSPENASLPYDWTIEVRKNDDFSTPTPTPTPTATRTTTETPVQDSDGDGMIDSEDYAPRDPAVQERSDLPTTTEKSPTTTDCRPAPGFDVGTGLAALLVVAAVSFVVVRRSE
jgi:hypothetical protein